MKHKGFQPSMSEIDSWCTHHHESKVDILYFMLEPELSLVDRPRAEQIRNLRSKKFPNITVDESLAIRIDTLLT